MKVADLFEHSSFVPFEIGRDTTGIESLHQQWMRDLARQFGLNFNELKTQYLPRREIFSIEFTLDEASWPFPLPDQVKARQFYEALLAEVLKHIEKHIISFSYRHGGVITIFDDTDISEVAAITARQTDLDIRDLHPDDIIEKPIQNLKFGPSMSIQVQKREH